MDITIQSLIDQLRDYTRNQNLTEARALRAINSACDFVFNHLGIPQLEKEQEVRFIENQHIYEAEEDFTEPVALYPADEDSVDERHFKWRPISEVRQKETDRTFSHFPATDGSWNLYIVGSNTIPSLVIDDFNFDNDVNWTPDNDADNVDTDNINYQFGVGCLIFDIDPALSGVDRATLERAVTPMDLDQYRDRGIFTAWVFLPVVADFDTISLTFGSAAADHYVITADTQADGSAFQVGWNELAWDWEDAVEVGNPDPSQITFWQFDFDYAPAYVGGNNYRIDELRLGVVDELTLRYYTRYKGQDSANNSLYDFTDPTDTLLWGNVDLALRNIIVAYAAIIINPQLLNDDVWVKEQYEMFSRTFKQKYPRKRIINKLFAPESPK